jgi:hypothetical protein
VIPLHLYQQRNGFLLEYDAVESSGNEYRLNFIGLRGVISWEIEVFEYPIIAYCYPLSSEVE